MKKSYFSAILVLLIILAVVFIILRGNEDTWIKDSKGVWIKHGNPLKTPEQVLEQQEATNCASELYSQQEDLNTNFSSQCLGTCKDYAVDMVHVPRTKEDNFIENQCADFREGKVTHFIELDKEGEIVRII
jgi:hypothetical protein